MGPEGQLTNNLQITFDGKPISGIVEVNITYPLETINSNSMNELEMCFKLPKYLRCHTRKRFIRFLMGEGASRNTANEMAAGVSAMRGLVSYQQALFDAWGVLLAVSPEVFRRQQRDKTEQNRMEDVK